MNLTIKKRISLILSLAILVSCMSGCAQKPALNTTPVIDTETIAEIISAELQETLKPTSAQITAPSFRLSEEARDIQSFVYDKLFADYSLAYDVFHAVLYLPDGNEITGFAYTDYASYYERDDDNIGYFPVGFIADEGYDIPLLDGEEGLLVENMDYSDKRIQYVYAYDTTAFQEHCVVNGQYLKYGVGDSGAIEYSAQPYQSGVCDESLGALFSYDDNKYLFDPDMGNDVPINGKSLYETLNFNDIEAEVNRILEEQNMNFSQQDIVSSIHIAQEAVVSQLLSMQQETFLGCSVDELVVAASEIDPMECIRITPEGYVIINIENTPPEGPAAVAKWTIGIACGIVVIGSTALNIFVPASRPLCGAITGAAIDVFMQVVVENHTLSDVNWSKVAVAAVSGALMAWACPLAAGQVAGVATKTFESAVLGKLCGYGVLTLANAAVSGTTAYVTAKIDGRDDGLNAFLVGAALGACCTVVATLLSEAISAVGPKITQLISNTKPGTWLNKGLGKTALFIAKHQVHLPDQTLENVLSPQSMHEAARQAMLELNGQTGALGGSYNSLSNNGDGSTQKHEIPAFSAVEKAIGVSSREEAGLPAIKMSAEDHRMTASFGASTDAKAYREIQAGLIQKGNFHDAIQMDIDDLTSKFGTKYADAISQMLDYAKQMGWW